MDAELAVAAHKRQREAQVEQWRLEQLRSGGAVKNSNFQPLVGVWREKVMRFVTALSGVGVVVVVGFAAVDVHW